MIKFECKTVKKVLLLALLSIFFFSITTQSEESETLKSLGSKLNITWGSSVGTYDDNLFYSDTDFMQLIEDQFHLYCAEGVCMYEIEPQQGFWTFEYSDPWTTPPDDIINYPASRNMKIRFLPLVYGSGLDWTDPETGWFPTPEWVREGDFTRQQMIDILYEYIETVMTRYGDKVDEWVVVNEPLGWGPDAEPVLKRDVWTEKLGEDYVELAFTYAHQVDPDAYLILNDWGADYIGQYEHSNDIYRVDRYYNYVKDLLDKGIPINGIGFQFHLIVGVDNPTVRDVVDNFARYGALGVDVHITEMDVRIHEPVTQAKLEEQARLYAVVMEAVIQSPCCNSITVWDGTDRYSWINIFNPYPGYVDPCMFDVNFEPKPAYYSVIEVMKRYMKKSKVMPWIQLLLDDK